MAKTKEAPDPRSYAGRFLTMVEKQEERRGILPEEKFLESFLLKKLGAKSLADLDNRKLRAATQGLDGYFREYLDGAKRRGEGLGLSKQGEAAFE